MKTTKKKLSEILRNWAKRKHTTVLQGCTRATWYKSYNEFNFFFSCLCVYYLIKIMFILVLNHLSVLTWKSNVFFFFFFCIQIACSKFIKYSNFIFFYSTKLAIFTGYLFSCTSNRSAIIIIQNSLKRYVHPHNSRHLSRYPLTVRIIFCFVFVFLFSCPPFFFFICTNSWDKSR